MRRRIRPRMSMVGALTLSLLLIAVTATSTMVLTGTAPEPLPPPDSPVRVAVIGDSYSAGSDNDVVWPTLIAAGSPLSISVVAVRDASYAGGQGQSGRFLQQVDKALASKPSVVVVFGGLGDAGLRDQQITQSAIDLFAELIRRAPEAKLVVFGPIWHTRPVPKVFTDLDAALAEAARVTFTSYVSLIDEQWLTGDGVMQGDVAPTDKGQSVLARELNPILLQQIRDPSRSVLP